MSKRSPIRGYNHNIGHRGLVFHVQTEDSGVDNPHIFTHLFHGGVIIFTRKLDYDAAADESVVKSLMQAQHKAVLKDLKRGTFEDKIDEYLGDDPELEPRPARDELPEGKTVARAQAADSRDDLAVVVDPDARDTLNELPFTLSDPSARDTQSDLPVILDEPRPVGAEGEVGDSPADWAAPAKVSNSEISDVFRVIMRPGGEGEVVRVSRTGPAPSNGPAQTPPTPTPTPALPDGADSRGPYGRAPGRDTLKVPGQPRPPRPTTPGASTLRPRGAVPPPPPPPREGEPRTGAAAKGNVLVSRPPIRVDSRSQGTRPPPPPPRRRAPRTVREDNESLFDQQTISEKSLDEVILAYLSEDARKEKS
ncbi:hypothetical protein [Haliangium sp.]|uniref:hypothetical protein n=1 Tax=Haliangium sp. TaxID=2663208 RepID=UPI003D10F179